jgi:nicotinamide phosphoribosyltransferase
MNINPLTALDFYKCGHRAQYPEGTTLVYSNLTPRSGKLSNLPEKFRDNKVVFFGLQYFIKHFLIDTWNEGFFNEDKDKVVSAYKRRLDTSLGVDAVSVDHIANLHDLGYLPIEILALPEGVSVPYKVPMLTIHNTLPSFFWLTNYLETVMSAYLWKPCTSATTAKWYRAALEHYAEETGTPLGFVDFQAHDFSMRGMAGLFDAASSGAGHLLFFKGTDTVPAIDLLETYYNADADKELIGCSVAATEHSVMCMGGKETELETFTRLLRDVYPTGIVSVVSDTWDFWSVVTKTVTELKDLILSRNGKLVIRPDSGDPVKIICGDPDAQGGSPEYKGAVQCLWDVFGGTVTDQGYKMLDSHIGLIYGDSITPQRTLEILEGLKAKGFASGNVVLGIGSFTYEYVTRDTHGFAVKSTYGEINGEPVEIFKDPKTDSGVKKSAKGLLQVVHGIDGEYTLLDQAPTPDKGELVPVFRNGKLLSETDLAKMRMYASL